MKILHLEEVNKNKTAQIRSMTHELRTPVNGTMNYLETAMNDKFVPDQIK
jgi:signal transduction histidine kinase